MVCEYVICSIVLDFEVIVVLKAPQEKSLAALSGATTKNDGISPFPNGLSDSG